MHPLLRLTPLLLALMAGGASANMGRDADTTATTDADFAAGRKAIDGEDWPAAVTAMEKAVAANPSSPDAHNWLGFAHRKLGQFDASFAAYAEALRLDPKHRGAHEYIGEAYLMTRQLAKAEAHLAELEKICTPIPCEEQKQLARAIATYKKRNP
jgi:tetratricopeptide (TPR) repeat protein